MATVRVEHTDTTVTCTGARHQLRLSWLPGGGLRVEAATRFEERWRRVDEDLVRLVRAVVHLRLAAPGAMPEMVAGACHLAGVAAPSRTPVLDHDPTRVRVLVPDPDPVRAIVRATYPLLAVEVGGRLPAMPENLPPQLLPAFRRATPRAAAELVFGGRVTRPLVRAFGTVFHGSREPDLFTLTVAAAASRHLEADHVVALLAAGRDAPTDSTRRSLTAAQQDGVATLAAQLPARRAVRLLTEGLADAAGRERLRFVATEAPPADLAAVVAGGGGLGAGVGGGGGGGGVGGGGGGVGIGGSGGLEAIALGVALRVVA
jgi:hypothetical protein